MKKTLIATLIILVNLSLSYGQIVNLDKLHGYTMIYEEGKKLADTYPNILKIIELGTSPDNRSIYALVMTDQVKTALDDNKTYVDKMHFFFEGGIHARENPGPVVLLKSIELYCQDYYNDKIIPEFSVQTLLKDNVLHFIPLTNPDGYDLVNRGLYTISNKNQKQLLAFKDREFKDYKSNINGVDINRNFPGLYFDMITNSWQDIWNIRHNKFISTEPSGAYYHGPYPGSEIETQLLMDYSLKYDFRSYISYHSRGEIIYYHKWMLTDKNNENTEKLAKVINAYTNYEIDYIFNTNSSSGYLTDYTAMQTLKPSITVESVHWSQTLPVDQKIIKSVYEELKLLPLHILQAGREQGYFQHKLYKDGQYIRDFDELIYAQAMATKIDGKVYTYVGDPIRYTDLNIKPMTKLSFIKFIMNDKVYDAKTYADHKPFDDCDDPAVVNARAIGIINGYNNKFNPDDIVSYTEMYVVLSNLFFSDYQPTGDHDLNLDQAWAENSYKVLIENDVIDVHNIHQGQITLGELKSTLRVIKKSIGQQSH